MKKNVLLIVLLTFICLGLTSCKNEYKIAKQNYFLYLDTVSNITVEYNEALYKEEKVKEILNKVNDILLEIEKEFSIEQTIHMSTNNISESALMKVNKNSGICPVEVSDSFINILETAQNIYTLSKGGFDPTIGVLSSLWDISSNAGANNDELLPDEQIIKSLLPLVDFTKVVIDKTNKTVFLTEKGMKLDLGGIAKGYACDQVVKYLQEFNFTYISVNLGGNLYVLGESRIYERVNKKVETQIQNPFDETTTIIKTTNTNMTIVSSGTYERYFTVDGKKYHHILDTKTGYPIENELVMVSIIGTNSCICDGLSTGIFSLGLEEGIKLIQSMEGYSAFFITNDKKIYSVGNIDFELTTTGLNNFELIEIE